MKRFLRWLIFIFIVLCLAAWAVGPFNPLYALKINVDEPVVQTALLFFPETSGKFAVRRLESRLADTMLLLSEGKQAKVSSSELMRAVEELDFATKGTINQLIEDKRWYGALIVANRLQGVEDGYSQVLAYAEDQDKLGIGIPGVVDALQAAASDTARVRGAQEEVITSGERPDDFVVGVEKVLEDTNTMLQAGRGELAENSGKINNGFYRELNKQLDVAADRLNAARDLHHNDQSDHAFVQALTSQRMVQSSSIWLETSVVLGLHQ